MHPLLLNIGSSPIHTYGVLIAIGILALAYGGFTYNREKTVIDIGSLHATATEHHHVPISPIAGAVY